MLAAPRRGGRRGAGVGQPFQPQQQLQVRIERLPVDPDRPAGQQSTKPSRETSGRRSGSPARTERRADPGRHPGSVVRRQVGRGSAIRRKDSGW